MDVCVDGVLEGRPAADVGAAGKMIGSLDGHAEGEAELVCTGDDSAEQC